MMDPAIAEKFCGEYTVWLESRICKSDVPGGCMSRAQDKQKTKKRPPKVRSYVRPTKVHTPRPRKKPKYPDKEIEEGLDGAGLKG